MIRLLTGDYFEFIRQQLLTPLRTLDILAYVINFQFYKKFYRSTQIFNLILSAKKKGTAVRIILDSSPQTSPNHRTNLFTAGKIAAQGIPVRMQTIPHPQHAKAFLFDNTLLVSGSHNLTQSALSNPLEMSIATDDAALVNIFSTTYNHLFNSNLTTPWERKLWPKSRTR